jgi:hypothetical protein
MQEYTLNEILLIRQSLDIIPITGKDAKYVTQLQLKLEKHIEMLEKSNNAKPVAKP